jgi:hypothetical protein
MVFEKIMQPRWADLCVAPVRRNRQPGADTQVPLRWMTRLHLFFKDH